MTISLGRSLRGPICEPRKLDDDDSWSAMGVAYEARAASRSLDLFTQV